MTLKLHNSVLVMVSSKIMFFFIISKWLWGTKVSSVFSDSGEMPWIIPLFCILFCYLLYSVSYWFGVTEKHEGPPLLSAVGFFLTQHNRCRIKCSVEREQLPFKQRRVELSRAPWLHKGGLRHQNLCYVYATHDIGHIIMVQVKNVNTFLQVLQNPMCNISSDLLA